MCGRYRLKRHWEQDLDGYLSLVIDKVDVELAAGTDVTKTGEGAPRDHLPIIRRGDDGELVPELRQWGFVLMVDGKTIDKATGKPKKIRRDVINAMSEKVATNYMWRFAFAERRCLIPMSSWDEWPETGAGKQRVRISKHDEPVFIAAGLYAESDDPKSGQRVPVFTMCTVPPTVLLGTVHDRAPMVLRPSEYDAWLEGGDAARALLGHAPRSEEFAIVPVHSGDDQSTLALRLPR